MLPAMHIPAPMRLFDVQIISGTSKWRVGDHNVPRGGRHGIIQAKALWVTAQVPRAGADRLVTALSQHYPCAGYMISAWIGVDDDRDHRDRESPLLAGET
jgi:hypothetical protein